MSFSRMGGKIVPKQPTFTFNLKSDRECRPIYRRIKAKVFKIDITAFETLLIPLLTSLPATVQLKNNSEDTTRDRPLFQAIVYPCILWDVRTEATRPRTWIRCLTGAKCQSPYRFLARRQKGWFAMVETGRQHDCNGKNRDPRSPAKFQIWRMFRYGSSPRRAISFVLKPESGKAYSSFCNHLCKNHPNKRKQFRATVKSTVYPELYSRISKGRVYRQYFRSGQHRLETICVTKMTGDSMIRPRQGNQRCTLRYPET